MKTQRSIKEIKRELKTEVRYYLDMWKANWKKQQEEGNNLPLIFAYRQGWIENKATIYWIDGMFESMGFCKLRALKEAEIIEKKWENRAK